MSGLVIRDKNGENISYFGTQFEGLEDMGSRHLCVRTGSGAEGVVKYALTSKPLNDKYKALRMRIADGASGKEAYIAQRYVESRTVSVSTSCTSSRSSQYISTKTLTTGSYTRVGTRNTTKSAPATPPVYYFKGPISISSSKPGYSYQNNETTSFKSQDVFHNDSDLVTFFGITGPYLLDPGLYQNISFLKSLGSNVKTFTSSNSTYSRSTFRTGEFYTRYQTKTTFGDNWNMTHVINYIDYYNLFPMYNAVTSKVSSYTQTYVSNVNSSSATQTATASRTSEYTSGTSALSTESFTSHNVDL